MNQKAGNIWEFWLICVADNFLTDAEMKRPSQMCSQISSPRCILYWVTVFRLFSTLRVILFNLFLRGMRQQSLRLVKTLHCSFKNLLDSPWRVWTLQDYSKVASDSLRLFNTHVRHFMVLSGLLENTQDPFRIDKTFSILNSWKDLFKTWSNSFRHLHSKTFLNVKKTFNDLSRFTEFFRHV